ncbi:M48 family metallopeptidase [Gemmatimonadota bacterium]
MPKLLLIIILLAPFVAWDATSYVLRERGDTDPARRQEILRHFSQQQIETGRQHVLRHNKLVPIYRAIFYLFYGLLLFAGLAGRLEGALLIVTSGRWYLALPLFVLVILLCQIILYLPLAAWRDFVIEREMGLSTITAGTWALDRLKSLAMNWVIVSLVALPVLWLVRALPGSWPLPAAGVILALSAFGIWISPWIIDPLFNEFTPLDDPRLEQDIRELSAGAGLKVDKVYVMDASRRSLYLNAYFTGLGNSRRVVLYDTLVKECSHDEVLSVVAHELGHWKHGHITKGFLLEVLGVTAGLWLLWLMLSSAGFRAFFNLSSPGSLALVVLLPFLISLAGTLISPAASALSRHFERQADMASLELTANPQAFISLEKRLVEHAKADLLGPPLLHKFYGSHPLPEQRIERAENWSATH